MRIGTMRSSSIAISRLLFKLLNDQGCREWEASLIYAGAAHWFSHNELNGSANWCRTHSDEERMHAFKIFEHLADRRLEDFEVEGLGKGEGTEEDRRLSSSGGMPSGSQEGRVPSEKELETEEPPQKSKTFEWEKTPNIVLDIKGPIRTTYEDPIDVWKTALEQERANSKRYFELVTAAREERDYVTEQFVMDFYIPEQLEEEKAVEEILENTRLVTKRGPEMYFELDRNMDKKPH